MLNSPDRHHPPAGPGTQHHTAAGSETPTAFDKVVWSLLWATRFNHKYRAEVQSILPIFPARWRRDAERIVAGDFAALDALPRGRWAPPYGEGIGILDAAIRDEIEATAEARIRACRTIQEVALVRIRRDADTMQARALLAETFRGSYDSNTFDRGGTR